MEVKRKVIAFCGTRGVPAQYGGFETAVDEITKRFIERNYECHVFCRHQEDQVKVGQHDGRTLIYVKGSKSRKLDTFVSSFRTGVYLLKNRKKYDYVFWFNNANLLGILLTLFTGIKFAVNTDGLEWRRAKWSLPFKAYYFLSSLLISLLCKNLISDSVAIQSYYKKVFHKKTQFIPYGVPEETDCSEQEAQDILKTYGLVENKYFLQVTRFEPDNLPLEAIKGFQSSKLYLRGYQYVLIGYKEETPYTIEIKACDGNEGVKVLPAIYDKKVLTALRKNSFCYVHGNSVGGTNPALLEAMQKCNRIMAIKGPFSSEVLGGLGMQFEVGELPVYFNQALAMEDQSAKMLHRLKQNYQWDDVAESYINLTEFKSANYKQGLDKQVPMSI
ncbi:DUF1972 domain-containing protein [Gorillibacterium sp. sgz5001074]|uniref:DUF1972 domain-containing protein n=1 Tax=Gorillibacterium sp. sgz5001074 TaxID=3446695 RepID=UPI003F67E55B